MIIQNTNPQQEIIFDKNSYLKSFLKDAISDKEVINKISNLTSLLRPSTKNNKINKKGI